MTWERQRKIPGYEVVSQLVVKAGYTTKVFVITVGILHTR